MKILILVLLLAVIASLFSGLYFVYKDKGQTNRAVISLTIRIALSVLVFVILIGSYYFAGIPQPGLKERKQKGRTGVRPLVGSVLVVSQPIYEHEQQQPDHVHEVP